MVEFCTERSNVIDTLDQEELVYIRLYLSYVKGPFKNERTIVFRLSRREYGRQVEGTY